MNVISLVTVRIELEQVEYNYRLGRQAYMKPTETSRLWKMIGSKNGHLHGGQLHRVHGAPLLCIAILRPQLVFYSSLDLSLAAAGAPDSWGETLTLGREHR